MGISIAIGFWLKGVYARGESVSDNAMVLAPLVGIYGLFMMIAPDLLLTRGEWGTAPAGKKVINIVIGLLGAGIGLWIRYGIFKAWK